MQRMNLQKFILFYTPEMLKRYYSNTNR